MLYAEAGEAGEVALADDELEAGIGVLTYGEVGRPCDLNLSELSAVGGIDDESIFSPLDLESAQIFQATQVEALQLSR